MKLLRRCSALLLATLGAVPASLWILRHEHLILRHGRPLTNEESSFAHNIGIRHPGLVRILAVLEIPSPMGGLLAPLETRLGFSLRHAAGVTLGHGIYLSRECESPNLVAHELVHVRQYQDHRSPLVFIWHYFYQCTANGYHHAPLEQEAVRLSQNHPQPNSR